MALLAVTLVTSLAAGWIRGGRVANLGRLTFRHSILVAVAIGSQLAVARQPGSSWIVAVLALSQLSLLAFFWLNRKIPGLAVIFGGFTMNAAVILLNGAMPVSGSAIRAITGPAAVLPHGRHRLLEAGDPLPFLADIIPVPPLRAVLSLGDLVVAAGVALLVVRVMDRGDEAEDDRSAADPVEGDRQSLPE